MIKDKSRKGWFGASDTRFIMGNWTTKTFMDWWQVKLGIKTNNFSNVYTIAGNANERKIANYIADKYNLELRFDRQVRIRKLRLRVNLDSETKDSIYEIKTYKITDKEWKLPNAYWEQYQVQLFGTRKRSGGIVAYGLLEEDYDNFFIEIDPSRIIEIPIAYDEKWIKEQYLPRLVYLAHCLRKRKTPNMNEFKENKWGKKK